MTRRDVVLGATLDGYAIEGGYDVEGGPHTSFGVAQSLGGARPSLRSSRTFEHLDELVTRAASLGFRELRLTVEWARLEPRPGTHDLDALAVYERVLAAAARESMNAIVVLCDAAWPSWLGQEPWLSSWAPPRFAEHARWLIERLGGLVGTVVTFRAPNTAAIEGWRGARRPPFRRGARADATSALDGMLVAHQRALEAVAAVAPTVGLAILFEVAAAYDDASLWRDLAHGAAGAGAIASRRRAWAEAVPTGRTRLAALGTSLVPRRGVDLTALRSTSGWASCPPSEWWLGGSDVELLAASLHDQDATDTTIELGAGPLGWDAQLAVALPVLTAVPGGLRAIHLRGLTSSTGPVEGLTGLLEVDQHNGRWVVQPAEPWLASRLAGGETV